MSYNTLDSSSAIPIRRSNQPRGHVEHRENRHHRCSHDRRHRSSTPPRQRGPPRPPSSAIIPSPRPPNAYSPNNHTQHPAPVPPYVPELAMAIFSAPMFLHLYLAPGQLGVLASPVHAHQNPDVTRPVIILHPEKDYKKLMERVGHAVKSVNPPAWGVSDIPPATWEGWGVKLFLPRDGPRIFKEIWETVGEKFHHLEVRLVPPQSQIDHNWFCVTSEQIMALENTRWDEEVEMYGRIGRMKYAEDVIDEPEPATRVQHPQL